MCSIRFGSQLCRDQSTQRPLETIRQQLHYKINYRQSPSASHYVQLHISLGSFTALECVLVSVIDKILLDEGLWNNHFTPSGETKLSFNKNIFSKLKK